MSVVAAVTMIVGDGPVPGAGKAAYLGLFALSVVVCGARALRPGEERAVWAVLAVGLAANAAAEFYDWIVLEPMAEVPLATVADLLWLALYVCCYVAIALLVRRRIRRVGLSQALDGVVVTAALVAVVAATVLPDVLHAAEGDVVATAVNLAYPVGDAVLLSCLVGLLSLMDWRPDPAALLLGAGTVLMAGADIGYLALVTHGVDERQLGAVEVLWPLGAVAMAWAAWTVAPRGRPEAPDQALRTAVVPAAALAVAIAVLGAGQFVPVGPTAGMLALVCIVAGSARGVLAFRDSMQLAASRRQALTDELTGLPNRRHFNERLRTALAESRQGDGKIAVLLMDLDRFKEVNDTLGHGSGDRLLQAVGRRLAGAVRREDTVARLGGDEFAVLLPGVAGAAEALDRATRLASVMSAPTPLDELVISTEVSIGLAIWPDHGDTPELLMRRADMAMYAAKEAHTGAEVFDEGHDGYTPERLTLVAELRRAIERRELVVHYQPKVELATGRIIGAEALIRWDHPQRGRIPPGEFIPAAEHTALIRPLTRYVLDEALSQVSLWRGRGHDVGVAVNLAVQHLLDDDLPAEVGAMLRRWSLPSSALELEITEGTLMADPHHALETLTHLSGMGVRVAIDDFGTGYSSMEYLGRLPVDVLKIDRSFVLGMSTDPSCATIVRSMIDLGHNLGLGVVAEGVEGDWAVAHLRRLGCDYAQGYHFGAAMPADDFERRIGGARERGRAAAEAAAGASA